MDLWYILPSRLGGYGEANKCVFEDDPPYETFLLLFISDSTRVSLESFGMAIAIAGVVGPGKVALGKLDLTEVLNAMIRHAPSMEVLTSRSDYPYIPMRVIVDGLKTPISTLMDMSVSRRGGE